MEMPHKHIMVLKGILMLALISTQCTYASDSKESDADCNSAYKGKTFNEDFYRDDINRLLEMHQEWDSAVFKNKFASNEEALKDPRRLNLCGSDLGGFDFSNLRLVAANFKNADLTLTNFNEASLSSAIFEGANFKQASVKGAVLKSSKLKNSKFFLSKVSGAYFVQADLEGVSFSRSDLSGATFKNSNLKKVKFFISNLKNARFENAILTDSYFGGSDMEGVVFEPDAQTLPNAIRFEYVKNIHLLKYDDSPHALIALRNIFRDAGWREQERKVTYAIKHTGIEKILNPGENEIKHEFNEKLEAWFNLVFFDLTTQWGMSPARALIILLLLIPAFAIFYTLSLRLGGKDGIWQDWPDTRVRKDLGPANPILLQYSWGKSIIYGLYFSFLSAFHIGWREVNVGNWIARIQPREYTLRASGWVRSIAGIQSLISVYLVAIWVLTYFGRPFDY
ncbi:MAG: hypothetical protein GQ553_02770 [Nitrosomonadaceae bacterium]|nr:hypothetical protein [Nitrosomonadaceae bacterium]